MGLRVEIINLKLYMANILITGCEWTIGYRAEKS